MTSTILKRISINNFTVLIIINLSGFMIFLNSITMSVFMRITISNISQIVLDKITGVADSCFSWLRSSDETIVAGVTVVAGGTGVGRLYSC